MEITMIEHLKKYPKKTIKEVAILTQSKVEDLRDAQLHMLRNCLNRNSELWRVQGYGR